MNRAFRPPIVILVAGLALAGAVLVTTVLAASIAARPAGAHGSTQSPPSRVYTCRFETPNNPMCASAWSSNSQALYDWMEVNIGDAAGRHRSLIPDGQLCSAGREKYAAFNQPGEWPVTNLRPDSSGLVDLVYQNTAPHSTEYYRVYITNQGFDARTDTLAWANLELAFDSGRLDRSPQQTMRVPLPNRDVPAVLYIVWQRSDSPEAFYACSDVTVNGGSPNPPTSTTSTPTATSAPDTSTPDTSIPGTSNPGSSAPVTPAPVASTSSTPATAPPSTEPSSTASPTTEVSATTAAPPPDTAPDTTPPTTASRTTATPTTAAPTTESPATEVPATKLEQTSEATSQIPGARATTTPSSTAVESSVIRGTLPPSAAADDLGSGPVDPDAEPVLAGLVSSDDSGPTSQAALAKDPEPSGGSLAPLLLTIVGLGLVGLVGLVLLGIRLRWSDQLHRLFDTFNYRPAARSASGGPSTGADIRTDYYDVRHASGPS